MTPIEASFLAQFTALRLLARGHYPPILSVLFETLRMPAVVPALAELIRPMKHRFRVTPKGQQSASRSGVRTPLLLTALFALSLVALAWFGLIISGHGPVKYAFPEAMVGTAGFLVVNVLLLRAAIRRVTDARYAGERRASVRFPVSMTATLNGRFAYLTDLSLTGARLRVRDLTGGEFAAGLEAELLIVFGDIHLDAKVVNVYRTVGDEVDLGIHFTPGQWPAVRRLALVLFHGNPGREQLAALAAA